MDSKLLTARKVEIEKEFNALNEETRKIQTQAQLLQKAAVAINTRKGQLKGAYGEICRLLGVSPTDESKLSVKPEETPKVEKKSKK